MGERFPCTEQVVGSIPISSTRYFTSQGLRMYTEKVTWVHHWTDKTFSFKTTRNQSFRFINGEFAMIGLKGEEEGSRPLLRAYSIASANYEDEIEFLSIKVPDGPLTSR